MKSKLSRRDLLKLSGTGLLGVTEGGLDWGDFDEDGYPDLLVTGFASSPYVSAIIYRNNGDGTFTDVTARAGVANGHRVGAGTCFLDMDSDGDLDLFGCWSAAGRWQRTCCCATCPRGRIPWVLTICSSLHPAFLAAPWFRRPDACPLAPRVR